jgi:hypothetical protein
VTRNLERIKHTNFTFDIHRMMRDHSVLLAFTGEFDMKIINALITSVKMKMSEVEPAGRIKKKVYNVMVECLESLFRNYEEDQKVSKLINSFSVFTLSRGKEQYSLLSGNYIFNANIDTKKAQIDNINNLSTEGKKKFFRDCISSETGTERDSDLAMIDIALKSGNKLGYEFKTVDELTSFFVFQVKINMR